MDGLDPTRTHLHPGDLEALHCPVATLVSMLSMLIQRLILYVRPPGPEDWQPLALGCLLCDPCCLSTRLLLLPWLRDLVRLLRFLARRTVDLLASCPQAASHWFSHCILPSSALQPMKYPGSFGDFFAVRSE